MELGARQMLSMIVIILNMIIMASSKATTTIDIDGIAPLYDAVRQDGNDINWLTIRYDNKRLVPDATGKEYDELLNSLTDQVTKFAYARIVKDGTAKFVFMVWAAPDTPPLEKARMSSDTALLKNFVLKKFDLYLLSDTKSDLRLQNVLNKL